MDNMPQPPNPRPSMPQHMSVSVRDIDMPFMSMVVFMIKWAFASIPAAIILLVFGAVFWGLVSLFCGGMLAAITNF